MSCSICIFASATCAISAWLWPVFVVAAGVPPKFESAGAVGLGVKTVRGGGVDSFVIGALAPKPLEFGVAKLFALNPL